MKARIKRYGQVIDVVQVDTRYESDGFHIYYAEAGSEKLTSLCLWKDTELDFNICEPVDWIEFRKEVAKTMLPITANWKLTKGDASISIPKEAAVKLAVEYADALIDELNKPYTK